MRAFAIGIVEDTRAIPNENEDAWRWGTIELTLADCYRQVSYDFNLNTKKAPQQSFQNQTHRGNRQCGQRRD